MSNKITPWPGPRFPRVIWKFKLDNRITEIELDGTAEFLFVKEMPDGVYIWIDHNPERSQKVTWKVVSIMTGEVYNRVDYSQYIGTAIRNGIVMHIFLSKEVT